MDALQMLQQDLPALIVGVALCTIAAGLFAFGLLGRRIANIDLPLAGAFAALNRIATIAFILGAAAGIPYDIARRHPGAFVPVTNAIVLFFVATFLINIVVPAPDESQDWRILRVATAIFGFYVINAHFNIVRDRYGFSSEPVGFLIFIGTIVFMLIRHFVRTQIRVASVDGELAAARQN